MRLVQEHLFKLLMANDDKQKFDLPKVAKSVAELERASVVQAKWKDEVRAKAEDAANQVEKIVKKGGLAPRRWKRFAEKFWRAPCETTSAEYGAASGVEVWAPSQSTYYIWGRFLCGRPAR